MKIVHMQTEIKDGGWPATLPEQKAKHDKILADLDAPVYLGRALKVNYDHKTDRYALAFVPAEDKALTLKATDEVAAFVAEHISKGGYWLGRMGGGALEDACLIQSD